MKKSILKIGLLALAAVFLLSGCSFTFPWEKKYTTVEPKTDSGRTENNISDNATSTTTTITPSGDLRKFASEDSLKNFLANSFSSGGLSASWLLAEGDYGQTDNGLADIVTSVGVSGADIIKASGGYIYAIVKNEIIIINALSAASAKIESRINLSSRPLELIVVGNRLAVFGSDQDIIASNLYQSFSSRNNYTFFKIFDVSEAAQPREVRNLSFEGGYVGVRLIGNHAYFLTAQPAAYRNEEPIMPRIVEDTKLISSPCSLGNKSCATSSIYYFDFPYYNHTFLSVNAINLANRDEAVVSQIYLIDPNYNLHLSAAGNFYLSRYQALSTYDLEQIVKLDLVFDDLSQVDQASVEQITSSPESLLNSAEKRVKTAAIIEKHILSLSKGDRESLEKNISTALVSEVKKRANDLEKTVVYKFSLKAGKIDYQARGEVYGKINSSAAWSEKEGNLRLATVRNKLWSLMFDDASKNYSNVYVLDSGLKMLGSLENIMSESVFSSVYFLGDRVYLSSVEDGASTYVVGLAEPTKPVVLGAVRMTGVSHIYQIDNSGEKVLAFGHGTATSSVGNSNRGLKLVVFDFSDLKKPKEVSSHLVGSSNDDSVAFKDYKALSAYPGVKEIIVPAALLDNGALVFSGALAFTLSSDGNLEMTGKLDHSLAGRFNQLDYWRNVQYYDNSVKRSFVSGSNLVTFSNKYLKINRLSDFSEVTSLTLTPDERPIEVTVEAEAEVGAEVEAEVGAEFMDDVPMVPVDDTFMSENPEEMSTSTEPNFN